MIAPIVKPLIASANMMPTISPNTPAASKKMLSTAFMKNIEHPIKQSPSKIAVPLLVDK